MQLVLHSRRRLHAQNRPFASGRPTGEPAVCDGTSEPFEVTLTSTDARRLGKGAAAWSASGYVEGDTGTQTVHVPPTPIALTR